MTELPVLRDVAFAYEGDSDGAFWHRTPNFYKAASFDIYNLLLTLLMWSDHLALAKQILPTNQPHAVLSLKNWRIEH